MRKCVALSIITVAVAACAFGQAAGLGSISGTVVDATGSAVPDATVIVANTSKGIKRQLATNGLGFFAAPALIPAEGYSVKISKSGFADFDAQDIIVAVGQTVSLHVDMSVAGTATTVDVADTAQIVEDTKTDVSMVVNSRQIMEMPISARRVDSFVLMSPGVAPDGAFGLLSFRGIAGHNNFLTDGNDTTNQFYNENAGRTRITSQISQEAVQEFQVISNNFAAEYGNAMGGVVNTVTKSGTNDLHGTGYLFFRNRSLNARDRYAVLNGQDIRKQFGASLGGAIVKDKLFFFTNYEGTRRDFPGIASLSTGMFNSAGQLTATCGAPATPAQCATATNMILTRNFGTVSRSVTQDLGFGKIDYHLNDKNTLSLSLSMLRWVSPHGIQATGLVFNTGALIGSNGDSTVRNAYGRAQMTTIIGSSMVNEARFGWFKDKLYDPASPDFLSPGLGLADLTVASTTNLGIAPNYPRLSPSEQRFSFADNLSWTKGAHTMKFGVEIAHTEDYQDQLITRYGAYNYATLGAFAADFSGNTTGAKNWTTYSQRFGNSVVDTNLTTFGVYAQDQFRVNSRLLFNYGVRWDYAKIPQPTVTNPDYPATGYINSTKDNFAPRVGMSYSIGKDRKTLFRAGYGIFFARYQSGLINTLFINNNLYQKSITYNVNTPAQLAAGPVYPNFLPSTSFDPPAGSTDIIFADKNFRNPYTHQANIGLERQLSSTIGVSASYIWSRGVRLYGVRDLNIGPKGAPVTYTIVDASGSTAGTYTTTTYRGPRVDPRYRRVSLIDNPALSYYDGLALQINKRFSKGFQAGASYTWSHAIDFNQSSASNNIFFGATPTTYENGDFKGDKGSAINDTRHRMVINFVWAPTFTTSTSAFAKFLINNWELSQITTLQSSQPVNSTTNISGNAFTGALNAGSLNGLAGGFSRVPFQPLSNLDLDRIYKVDARLTKRLPVTERVQVILAFEAFNVFNTPYDTGRRTAEYDLNATTATLTYRKDYGSGSSTAAAPDGTTARRAQVALRVTF